MQPGPDGWRLAHTIAERRAAAALSKAALARLVGYTKAHVSRAENARYGVPSLAVVSAIGRALGCLDELLALRQRAVVERSAARRALENDAAQHPLADPRPAAFHTPEEALRIVSQQLASSNISPVLLDELDEQVAALPYRYATESHAELSGDVWQTWCQVVELLSGHRRLADRARLIQLAATLSCYLGRLALNLGQLAFARRFALVADQFAEDLGHDRLRGTAHLLMASVDFSQGNPQAAIRILDRASDLVRERSGWQVAHRARALASLGQRQSALPLIEEMSRLAETPAPEPAVSPFTVAAAEQWSAGVFVYLGEGEQAEPLARSALSRMEGDSAPPRIDHDAALLDLGLALVLRRKPDYEQAAACGLQVLNQSADCRTEAILRQARQLGEALGKQSALPAARQYRELLSKFTFPPYSIAP
jgi:transcriptional regulator with XRE-family HTH domain